MKKLIPYEDVAHLTEDSRIQAIGRKAMEDGLVVGFIVETNEKADRYMAKLNTKFPGIVEEKRFPVAGALCVRVKSSLSKN